MSFPPHPDDPVSEGLLAYLVDLGDHKGIEDLRPRAAEVLGRPVDDLAALSGMETTRVMEAVAAQTRPDGTNLCEHLVELERALLAAGYAAGRQFRPRQRNTREWAYFDCILHRPRLRVRLELPAFVVDHELLGTHDGQEAGFVCERDHDAVLGHHPAVNAQHGWGKPVFG